tara:strand:- start:764 stop:991 length:228 start_codon:yes stop_codon:yes gene_type:complete
LRNRNASGTRPAAIPPFPFWRRVGSHAAPFVLLYNQQLPQSALGSKAPLQAMKDWHRVKPELFKKKPYYLTGCDK